MIFTCAKAVEARPQIGEAGIKQARAEKTDVSNVF